MTWTIQAFIDHWIIPSSWQDYRDIVMESLTVLAFLFLLVVIIISMKKSPILNKHGSIEFLFFVILGFVHATMNVFDEFAWIGPYTYWKLGKDLTLLFAAIILVVGFFRFFTFSWRLLGEEDEGGRAKKIEETTP
ncbi:MAG: hypothetical protein ACTSUA_05570 [Candidatus Heimdallarchaeota archaeon]|nr:MAG: hypothetical protein DRP02_08095 [Candidatus Gerdarchaeota archaeon]